MIKLTPYEAAERLARCRGLDTSLPHVLADLQRAIEEDMVMNDDRIPALEECDRIALDPSARVTLGRVFPATFALLNNEKSDQSY